MGAWLLDWDTLLPPPVAPVGSEDAPVSPQNAAISPELGEISPIQGKRNVIEGKYGTALEADLDEISPISPISPRKITESEVTADTGGGGRQDYYSARMFRNDDDRINCRNCDCLAAMVDPPSCKAASLEPGALVRAVRGYRPVVMPHRCRGFVPLPGDPDQRSGVVRWPGLYVERVLPGGP
jgi:hypothetical protein